MVSSPTRQDPEGADVVEGGVATGAVREEDSVETLGEEEAEISVVVVVVEEEEEDMEAGEVVSEADKTEEEVLLLAVLTSRMKVPFLLYELLPKTKTRTLPVVKHLVVLMFMFLLTVSFLEHCSY